MPTKIGTAAVVAAAFAAALPCGAPCAADAPLATKIVVSAPGPRNISYLPVDLIPKIGADRAEGAQVQLLHTGGGGVALNNLMNHNADFSVAGFPAAMSARAKGGKVVGIAAVDGAPLFIFMVRADLRDKVRRFADLKGRVIGVNTSSLSSKTTSQQLAELLLASDGVRPDMVRILPAGQSWVEQSSLINSGAVDAIMGDEPFASRLLAAGKVFFLANLADARTAAQIPGAGFLHATVEAREDMIERDPAKVEKMVRIMRRSLQWIASHSPEEIVDRLGVEDAAERESLLFSLKKYPGLFSKDGSFSTRQLAETELFFRTTSKDDPAASALQIEIMVDDQWAGRTK